jgi:hypothetical protein
MSSLRVHAASTRVSRTVNFTNSPLASELESMNCMASPSDPSVSILDHRVRVSGDGYITQRAASLYRYL